MSLLKSARLVSALTMLSRLLGLAREQLLAGLLAAGPEADAYMLAFRIPNMFRDLLAEGALSAAFVPTFTRVQTQRSKQDAFVLGQRVAGLLFVVVSTLTLLGYLFTEPLVHAIAPGFDVNPAKAVLTLQLTQVMLPFLVLTSFAAVAMGMLNAQRIFGPPAFASSAFNVVAIACGTALAFWHLSPAFTAWGWSVGVVLGGVAQVAVQVPALLRSGFKPRLRLRIDGDVKAILRMMGPATLGLAATQVNIVINSRYASDYPGAVSWLSYAFRLLYLPIGVFGVAIATVSATSLAEGVAKKDDAGVRKSLRDALTLLAFLTVPSSVGLWVLSEPIIALVFQRGAFDATQTQQVAQATAVYALGLFAYSAVKVLAPVYYARQKSYVPLIASVCAVVANIAISSTLQTTLGFLALALGTSVAAWVNVAVLRLWLPRASGVSDAERVARREAFVSFLKVLVCGAIMGGFGAWLLSVFPRASAMSQPLRIGYGLGTVALCGFVYIGAALALRVPEVTVFVRRLRRGRA
jgi:putative peptidoglycan lipid II flippase